MCTEFRLENVFTNTMRLKLIVGLVIVIIVVVITTAATLAVVLGDDGRGNTLGFLLPVIQKNMKILNMIAKLIIEYGITNLKFLTFSKAKMRTSP